MSVFQIIRLGAAIALAWLVLGVANAESETSWQGIVIWAVATVCVTAVLVVALVYEEEDDDG